MSPTLVSRPWVYVPGVSELINLFSNAHYEQRLNLERRAHLLHRIPRLTDAEVLDLARAVEAYKEVAPDYSSVTGAYFEHLVNHPMTKVNDTFLLFLLYFCAGELDKADHWLDVFVRVCHGDNPPDRLVMFKKHIQLLRDGHTHAESADLLAGTFGKDLVRKYRVYLSGNQEALPYPICFECDTCTSVNRCSYEEMKHVVGRLDQRYAKFNFDQTANRDLFGQTPLASV